MKSVYGQIKKDDITVLKTVVELLKEHDLAVGIHGTSLWNPEYKDIDLVVFGMARRAQPADFLDVIDHLKKDLNAEILKQRGDEKVGFEVELKVRKARFHLSYVILLT
ncbi:hypothetical protein IH979_00295 [Patescibacteria group bacterium]|nr:hypothetical protein [Patescibacteria group bacterium]